MSDGSQAPNPVVVNAAAALAVPNANAAGRKGRDNLEGVTTLPTNMAALEREYPELFRMLAQSQFCNVMREQKRSQDRIKAMNREMYQN